MEISINRVEFKKEAKKLLDGKTWLLLLCNVCFLGIAGVFGAAVFFIPNPLEKLLTNFIYGKGFSEIDLTIITIDVEWLCWGIYMFIRSIIFAAVIFPFYICLSTVPLSIVNNEKIEVTKIFAPISKSRYFVEYAIAGVQKYLCTVLWTLLIIFPGTKNYNTKIKADEFSDDFYKTCAFGKVRDVEKFLKQGKSVNELDTEGYSPLFYAVLGGNPSAYAESISKFRDAIINDDDKALYEALDSVPAVKSNTKVVDYLLKKGGNIDEQNKFGTTPIMWAAMYTSNPDVIDVLKKNGADINDKRHKDGYSPLIWAVRCNRNPAVTERICELGADITTTDKYTWHALDWAMLNSPSFKWNEKFGKVTDNLFDYDSLQKLKAFKTLQEEGKNSQLKVLLKYCSDDALKTNALQSACFSSNENFSDLINSITKFEGEDWESNIFYYKMLLISFNEAEKLKLLNSRTDNDFDLQFYYAILCNSNSVAEYLLSQVKEMDISLQTNILTDCNNSESLNIFLQAPFIDVFRKDASGKTMLYVACEKNNYEAAKLLLEKGADSNTTCSSQKSRTPLLTQCYMYYPSSKIVQLLISNGARINAKDEDGVSPLIAACYANKNDSVIRILINNGADKTEKYKDSYPYEYCNTTIMNDYYSTYETLYIATKNSYW